MKVTDSCTKKVRKQITQLGWPLIDPTWDHVFRYLMEEEELYVMPIPLKDHQWEVGVVILGKPNTHDNLLNRISVAENIHSYHQAIRVGVEYVVNELLKARREIEKAMRRPDFNELMYENIRHCREAGFDID